LLDAHEVAVRARVEELRERAARVAVELGEAKLALEHVVITKATLAMVLAGGGGVDDHGDDASSARRGGPRVPVPAWTVGLDERALPADASFCAAFDAVYTAAEIQVIRTGIRASRQDSIVERWFRSLCAELTNRTLVWILPNLMRLLRDWSSVSLSCIKRNA
jgi:hypothetical protein